jgi:large subunit ribosomal protein L30
MKPLKKLKIIQKRSIIDTLEAHKRTIKALGLGRPNSSAIHNDTPAIRGMINKVRYLLEVQEVEEK